MITRQDDLRERLETAFRGSRYHSLLGALKGLSEEDARWVPPHYSGFPHADGSILNLTYHAGGDKHVLISTAFGDGSMGWELVGTRFAALGGDLPAARRLAELGHATVLAVLDAWPEGELDAPRPYYGNKSYTAAGVFALVAEHDIYHAGQIVYARSTIAGIRQS